MNRIIISVAALFSLCMAWAGHPTWGDQGNGTYINPILNADYSDPDAIRVGDKYYMVASDFHFTGMQVLESSDLVNWTLVSQVYDRFDFPGWETNERYAGGSWAPSIRYHDGKFWIFFCTPHEGLFMSTATSANGPWSPLTLVEKVARWEDPCPFWDDDGQAYLGRSKHGAGPIIIHKMSPDGTRLLDEGRTVYTGPVAEGTKIHKRDGWYYLSIPEGGVESGWQTILRSRNIYGPYEKRVVLEQGRTPINGPHQGAMVDTPEGEWWFLHFQHSGPLGRVVHLQPMHWKDGWPVIGVDQDMNGIGEPVPAWVKPRVHASSEPHLPAHTDEFSSSRSLGLQWQFNHNPVPGSWSLTERVGWLTLHASKASDFKQARGTLTQKSMGYRGEVTVRLDFSSLAVGDHAGLACMGKQNHLIGVQADQKGVNLYLQHDTVTTVLHPVKGKILYLRLHLDAVSNTYSFAWSRDGRQFTSVGEPFAMRFGFWKGVRPALFCYNPSESKGTVSFDWFRYLMLDDEELKAKN